MNLVLTEQTCKVCKGKLTEYEYMNNGRLCMDCYAEEEKKATEQKAKLVL